MNVYCFKMKIVTRRSHANYTCKFYCCQESSITPSTSKEKAIKSSNSIDSNVDEDSLAESSSSKKRKSPKEDKSRKKAKKEPSDDEDGDETSSFSDYELASVNNCRSSSATGNKNGEKGNRSRGLLKKQISSAAGKDSKTRNKSSDGSNSSEAENKKEATRLSREEREKLRRAKESKINQRRGRKPKVVRKEAKEGSNKEQSNSTATSSSKKKCKSSSSVSLAILKKTGRPFLQKESCCEVSSKLPKCRECRMTPNQRNKKMPNIFCRFYDFRKLRYGKNNGIMTSGFSEPKDATEVDLKLWLPPKKEDVDDENDDEDEDPEEDSCKELDIETSKFIILHVGDQFCDLVKQEMRAQKCHMGKDKTISWKRVVIGVREMCDVCETTLFNIHWVCHKCGFVICIDCYTARRSGEVKEEENPPRDRDEYQWLLCTNRQPHEQDKLMMTQIIASTALSDVGRLLHLARKNFDIPSDCGCDLTCISNKISDKKLASLELSNTLNGISTNKMSEGKISRDKNDCLPNGANKEVATRSLVNGIVQPSSSKTDSENSSLTGFSSESGSSPLSWLADVALSSRKINPDEATKDGKNSANKTSSSNSSSSNTKATASNATQNSISDSSKGKSDKIEKEDEESNFSTLRELLIRPNSGSNCKEDLDEVKTKKALSEEDDENTNSNDALSIDMDHTDESGEDKEATSDGDEVKKEKQSFTDTENTNDDLDEKSKSANLPTPALSNSATSNSTATALSNSSEKDSKTSFCKLKHYIRQYKPLRSSKNLPSRQCTVEETRKLYPDVAHTWMCSGRLCVFQDSKSSGNLKLFQEQWKRGQVSIFIVILSKIQITYKYL